MPEKSIADKILDFLGKFSLIKPEKPLSELAPWNQEEPPEGWEEAKRKTQQNKKEALARGDAESIFSKALRFVSKTSPYTRPTGPGRDDPNQTYPTRAGYKY